MQTPQGPWEQSAPTAQDEPSTSSFRWDKFLTALALIQVFSTVVVTLARWDGGHRRLTGDMVHFIVSSFGYACAPTVVIGLAVLAARSKRS